MISFRISTGRSSSRSGPLAAFSFPLGACFAGSAAVDAPAVLGTVGWLGQAASGSLCVAIGCASPGEEESDCAMSSSKVNGDEVLGVPGVESGEAMSLLSSWDHVMGGSEWSALIGGKGQVTITSAAAELVRGEGVMLGFVLAVVEVTNGIGIRLAAALRAFGYEALVQRPYYHHQLRRMPRKTVVFSGHDIRRNSTASSLWTFTVHIRQPITPLPERTSRPECRATRMIRALMLHVRYPMPLQALPDADPGTPTPTGYN